MANLVNVTGNIVTGQLPDGRFFTAPLTIDAGGVLRVDLSNIPPAPSTPRKEDKKG